MQESFPFRDELRKALVEASDAKGKHRHRPLRLAGIAAALIAVIGVFTVGVSAVNSDPVEAAVLSVTKDGDFVKVRIEDLKARPQDIEKELKAVDVSSDAVPVPVPSSAIGEFMSLATSASFEFQPVIDSSGMFREFRVRTGVPDTLQLGVGRVASPGERYAKSFDAFGSDGPLRCTALVGKIVKEAKPEIDRLGLNVSWRVNSSESSKAATFGEVINDLVVGGFVTSDRDITIVAARTIDDSSVNAPLPVTNC